jgi:hypothetical protein
MALTRSILADNSPYYEAGLKKAILQKMKNGICDVFKPGNESRKLKVIKHRFCNAGNF